MFKRSVLTLVLVCSLICSCASLASGDAPAPGYEVIGRFGPTNLPPVAKGGLSCTCTISVLGKALPAQP